MTNFAQLQTKHARKCCRWKWSIFLNASSGSHTCSPGFARGKSVPLLYTVIHGWPWMVRSTSCKAVSRTPKLPPTSLAKTRLQRTPGSTGRRQKRNSWHKTTTTRFAASYLILYHLWQVDYASSWPIAPNAGQFHNTVGLATSNTLLSWGQAGPSASMERKLPTTWEFTFSTSWEWESCASATPLSGFPEIRGFPWPSFTSVRSLWIAGRGMSRKLGTCATILKSKE